MSEHLEDHYELMQSGRWRVDRSDLSGEVFYYPLGIIHPVKMILEDAIEMERILKEWTKEKAHEN